MKTSRILCSIALAFMVTAGMQARALNPAQPPGGNFDLNNWYLGLPIDIDPADGYSDSIPASSLEAGFTNDYFYTDTDGSMVMWAPVNGATTPGSSFPRSELREQIVPGNNNINWDGYGIHILAAECKVTQLPSSKKVIIGQIHSKTGLQRPLVKLQYDGNQGRVRALIKEDADDPDNSDDVNYNFPSVGLNETINYTIQMLDGVVTITVNGQVHTRDVFGLSSSWEDEEFYFKAGSYCQDNSGDSSEGARVAFYELDVSHGGAGYPTLTVTSPYGTGNPPAGTNYYLVDTLINATMTGSPVVNGTTQHLVTAYTGTGDVGSGSGSSTGFFTLTQDSTIDWHWQTQYWLDTEVYENSGGIVDVDDTWINAGSNITITAMPWFGSKFLGWTGDVSSTNPVITVTMDQAISVTAVFGTPVNLTVTSPYGNPTPGTGTAGYIPSTVIDASMAGSPDVNGTTRHLVTGWTGTGDVTAGSGSATSFTLNQTSTITWQWQTQFWLDTEVSGNGSVDVSDDWYDDGAGVTITASPAIDHHFVSWSGDSSSTNPVLNLTMDAAKTVTATFASDPAPPLAKRVVMAVSASGDDGNIPENTLDGDLGTRWSAQGDGVWITYDLGVSQDVHELKLAWYSGDIRNSFFDVLLSMDGTNWTAVLTNQSSSGTTVELEDVNIPNTAGRYLRIVGHGNTASDWTSLTEVEIWGVPADIPAEVYMPMPEMAGSGVQFTVPSVSGALYQLQYSDLLTPPSWGDMGAPVMGDGDDLIMTDPGPLITNRFYRVLVLP